MEVVHTKMYFLWKTPKVKKQGQKTTEVTEFETNIKTAFCGQPSAHARPKCTRDEEKMRLLWQQHHQVSTDSGCTHPVQGCRRCSV